MSCPRRWHPLDYPGGVAGVNDLSVFVMTSDFAQGFCRGANSGGVKLCTLGADVCVIKIHRTKKVDGSLYIAAGRNGAYAQHYADASTLTPAQLTNVLNERRSREEWVRLLHGLKLSQEANIKQLVVEPSAITPAKKRKPLMEDEEIVLGRGSPPPGLAPSFSSDSDGLVIIRSASSEDMQPEKRMGVISQQWDEVIANLNRLTGAFKRFKTAVSTELEQIDDRVTGVDARIGHPDRDSTFSECITSWDGIMAMKGVVEDLRKDFEDSKQGLADMSATNASTAAELKRSTDNGLAVVNGHLEELANFVKVLNDEQAMMSTQVQLNASPVPESAFRELQLQVRRLQAERDGSAKVGTFEDHSRTTKAEVEIAALKIQLNILASRIPVDATMYLGGQIFKSKGDVQLFVEKKMSTNLFHLCHDPITLLESLTGLHVEKKDVLNEMYQADRVGMNDAEARHCASFRLILPTVLGYVKEGASTHHNLPAVKTFKDWNPRDGTSGVKAYVATGLDDLKLQVRQEIEDSFPSTESEAKSLARDMHDGSQTFLSELMAFTGDFFDELMHSSDTTEEEAWELLSALLKRIFEEFRKVRASAANAARDKNPTTRCSTYLWASIQVHRVMKEMLDARFRNHVAIAPVIILHVFKTRITKVAHTAALKRLEGRIAALEKTGLGKKKEAEK